MPPPFPPPPAPRQPSPEEIVSKAIKEAKTEITAKQARKNARQNIARANIKGVRDGLSALREASNQAFDYTVEEQSANKLKVTTTLPGKWGTITVNGDSRMNGKAIGVGKGFARREYYDSLEGMLTHVTKAANKRGLLP